jgi:SAM-dependent methyltransferase
MKIPADWHKHFYKNSFYNPVSPAAAAKAPMETGFIIKQLRLKKGAKVLDLCCGPGRHALLMAEKGLAVTGFDYSPDYLREAAGLAGKAKVKLRLMLGDMRRLKFREEFDAVVNLFTSFGYFEKIAEDVEVLKGVARALRPGGAFMLDVVHGDFIRRNFRPKNWEKQENGAYLLTEAELARDGVRNEWTVVKKGEAVRRRFFTRLYTRSLISSVLRRSGLVPLKFWGGFSGVPLTSGADRLIVLARKL